VALICSYPVLQIRPYGLLVYEHKEFSKSWDLKQDRAKKEINGYTGKLTTYSKKKLKRAIGLMVATAEEKEATNFKTGKQYKFKLNFITLTLPAAQGEIEDKTIKVCLDNWIKRAKRKHNLRSYVWRAERQANGNIHFHVITDTWIHYEQIRNDWNSVLWPTGLIQKYQAKHGIKQPNSTDVHAIWKVRNLTSYFVKYMSKSHKEGEKPINGKVWDCSSNLKTKKNCSMFLEGQTLECYEKLTKDESLAAIVDSNFVIIFIPPDRWLILFLPEWLEKWKEYLAQIRNSPG
jgi:hypothetical protein